MRSYSARVLVWIIVYLLFILGPLFALMLGSWPPARDFWTEFSVALGYAGLAMMGLQFGLTARFRYITKPWGDDLIYHVHRQLSMIAVGLVTVHPLILFVDQPAFLALLNTFTAPWRARFAALSVYSLIAIVVMGVWRTKLKLSYETWHISHIWLAAVAVAAGVLHMVGWGYYLASPWKRGLWIGMSVFWVGLLFYVRVIKPWFLIRRPYRVAEVRQERGDTHTLVMQPEGHPGFRFIPGQFGWLTVWESPFKASGHPFVFSSSAAVSDGRVEMSIRTLGDFYQHDSHHTGGKARLPRRPLRYIYYRRRTGPACTDRRRRRHRADDEHHPNVCRSRGRAAHHSPLRQQGLGISHLPGGT